MIVDPNVIAEWKDFFVAVSGTAAAFAGLLFVGLSINLARIIALPGISGRAGETLILLGSALVSALLGLVPQQPASFGWELFCVGSVVWIVVTNLHIDALRRLHYDTVTHGIQRVAFAQAATLPLLIGAALFLWHRGGSLYWLVPGLILPLLVSMFNAWVLLVEIMR
jgi:modulator of FtsH protease